MPPIDRSRFAGMLAIIRYNWQFYLIATVVVATCSVVLTLNPAPLLFWPSRLGLLGSIWCLVGSLGASAGVADRAPL